ncbi:MAG: tetratricopeptide repeat protein [Candidatus Aminicenantes bacterium]|nr:tetratricopeptide repeat protein [Candidatus Aminicenantes bacterium]
MKKSLLITAAFLLLSSSLGSLAPQNGYDQFQKALAKERGEGNLEEAIAIYQKVINETKDEALAAQAQLRIGFCFEKLGREEAQKAFQKVIDKYPAQTEMVRTAKDKLALLLRIQSAGREWGRGLQLRQVLSTQGSQIAHQVSPDGRYLAYFDYGIGTIVIQELATGETRALKSKISGAESAGECWFFRWSPDGKSVVCNWWQDMPSLKWADLRLLFVDGSAPRRILGGDYVDVYPFGWSSDGRTILAAIYREENQSDTIMGIISVDDGSVRVLKTIEGRLGNMGFSPDGRFVAYDSPSEEGSDKRDIFIISAGGKADVPLVTHPAQDALVGWSPDGRLILFSSDRLGTADLWAVAVADGRPARDPEVIKRGIGNIEGAGITQAGSLYFTTSNDMMDIYVVEVDQETGKIIAPQKKLDLPRQGSNRGPQYSPDGKYLAYFRDSSPGRGESSLCVFSLETKEEQNFPLGTWGRMPRWSRDGRFLYFTTDLGDSQRGMSRLDLQTGQRIPLGPEKSNDTASDNLFIGCSPEGASYYYMNWEAEEKTCRIRIRDFEKGTEKELFRAGTAATRPWGPSAISPDGNHIAIVSRDDQRALTLIPTSGGEARVIHQFEQKGGWPTMLTWTTDGRYIIFSRSSEPENKGWGLWRISANGGEPHSLGMNTRFISWVCAHPDGKQLAFSMGEGSDTELWVMENFLPGGNAQGKDKRQRE